MLPPHTFPQCEYQGESKMNYIKTDREENPGGVDTREVLGILLALF
jgi:hypothetical protein